MMTFPSTLEEENLLMYDVSDEALETAGGGERNSRELYPWVLYGPF
jgi:hypothetical protein